MSQTYGVKVSHRIDEVLQEIMDEENKTKSDVVKEALHFYVNYKMKNKNAENKENIGEKKWLRKRNMNLRQPILFHQQIQNIKMMKPKVEEASLKEKKI